MLWAFLCSHSSTPRTPSGGAYALDTRAIPSTSTSSRPIFRPPNGASELLPRTISRSALIMPRTKFSRSKIARCTLNPQLTARNNNRPTTLVIEVCSPNLSGILIHSNFLLPVILLSPANHPRGRDEPSQAH
ncbi:hypothetical protein M0R45_028905 [Rubus argutus]|uniref:Uncharacterized protein n=1 Tax=Rubus argutus TaxID=59490 RepID=A0AAW1W8Q8_RUBAR